jgi:hypothetical protein
MPVESFGLNEHFDYMINYIPQPFGIASSNVKEFRKESEDYIIVTNDNRKYTLTLASLKKLVDSLGVKVRLLNSVCNETDVIDLAIPIINKLFKCFADCFVFYASQDDSYLIIDLNVNKARGEEGTMYENGPSPWSISISEHPRAFTCFTSFKDKYSINDSDTDILVKADDILQGSQVTINLFKEIAGTTLQPMITFSSKFSNLNGFVDIYVTLYDPNSDIYITFPMNYAKGDGVTLEELWKRALHLYEKVDLNDFISQEISELAASDTTPNNVRNFITSILVDSVININQPIKDILTESVAICNGLKQSKAKKLRKSLGSLIAWAVCMKHSGCSECHHLHI